MHICNSFVLYTFPFPDVLQRKEGKVEENLTRKKTNGKKEETESNGRKKKERKRGPENSYFRNNVK